MVKICFQVYEFTMEWLKYDENSRLQFLTKLMECIQMQFLPMTYLVNTIEKEKLIKSDFECR